MDQENRCPQCGAELAADVPQGLCPACLLKRGLETQTDGGEGSQPNSAAYVPPTPEELAPHFPDLEILALVGRGGMGVVYKARQKRLDRLVALKILSPKIGEDPAFAERFAREARAMAMLSHPHIVTVYDFGQTSSPLPPGEGQGVRVPAGDGGLYYFLMEFVDGLTLRQLLNAGKLAPQEALAIVPQICEALQYAHDKGVVHRDIKPENILMDRSGQVKIADFGLAKLVGREAKDFTLTGAGQVMGTPHYMAPEQFEHPHEVDHRADIYSLGVVFYQMLTGELPLGRFAPPSRKVQVDVRLDEVVLRALEKEPERRYQQASEIKTEVETIVTTPPSPVSSGRDERKAQPPKLDWIMWSPFQPPLVREICTHMTEAEKKNAIVRAAFYGMWCASPTCIALMYGFFGLIPGLAALLVVLLIACIIPWQRKQREFLCSTAWARQQGIQPDQLVGGASSRASMTALWITVSIAAVAGALITMLSVRPTAPVRAFRPAEIPPAVVPAKPPAVVAAEPPPPAPAAGSKGAQGQPASGTATSAVTEPTASTIEGPLRVSPLPAGWKLEYNDKQGIDSYSITPQLAGSSVLTFSRWRPPSKPEDIPALVRQIADGFLADARKWPDMGLASQKYDLEQFVGDHCHGNYAVFRLKNAGLAATFVMSVDGQTWNGQFTGTPDDWQKALELLKRIKSDAANHAASFGPVIERVIQSDIDGQDVIDLDTGKLYKIPDTALQNGNEFARWVKDTGADAVGAPDGLMGFDMMASLVDNDCWNISVARLTSAFVTDKPGPRPMFAKGELPATYLFETREGGMGVLQIVGVTDKPPGAKIRYKLVHTAPAVPAVTATGTIEPEKVIDVEASREGTIDSLGPDLRGATDPRYRDKTIDYGSPVEVGTVLARIDDAVYKARVDQQKAACARAEAELAAAQAKAKRETSAAAKAAVVAGEAAAARARAALKEAENDRTIIASPVKGFVIACHVHAGQSVTRGQSLFLVAQDTGKVRVRATLDEAKSGRIHQGMDATITVKGLPNDVFKGTVTAIRRDETTTQNAVTFTVVVDAENPNHKLMPYRKATVQFAVAPGESAGTPGSVSKHPAGAAVSPAETGAMVSHAKEYKDLTSVEVAEARLKAAQAKAEDDADIRYATAYAKLARSQYESAQKAHEKSPPSVSKEDVIQLSLKCLEAELGVEKTKREKRLAGEDAKIAKAELDLAVLRRSSISPPELAAAEAKYALQVAEVKYNIAKLKADDDVNVRYVTADAEARKAIYQIAADLARKTPAAVSKEDLDELSLKCKMAELSVEKAKGDQRAAVEAANVAKAEWETAARANGVKPAPAAPQPPVEVPAGKPAADKQPDRTAKEQAERIETLKQHLNIVTLQYQTGSATVVELAAAMDALREAELAAAKTKAERIAIRQKLLEDRRDIERIVAARVDAGAVSKADLLQARAARLEAESRLAMEKAEPLAPGKLEQAPADRSSMPTPGTTSLAEAVRVFNARAKNDKIGKDQPPLTEDEVIAAVRWSLLQPLKGPVSDKTLQALSQSLRRIADTRELPQGFELEVITRFEPNDRMEVTKWSVRLSVPVGPRGTTATTVSIREVPISSRLFGTEERKVIDKWQKKWQAQGGSGDWDGPQYEKERIKAAEIDRSRPKSDTSGEPQGPVLLYEIDPAAAPAGRSASDTDTLLKAIDRRLNSGAERLAKIRKTDDGRFEVALLRPGDADRQRVQRLLARPGTLEFRILANNRHHRAVIEQAQKNPSKAEVRDSSGKRSAWWVPVKAGQEGNFAYDPDIIRRTKTKDHRVITEILVVTDPCNVTGRYLTKVAASVDNMGNPCVRFTLNEAGGKLFAKLTGDHLPDSSTSLTYRLGIVLDGELDSAPSIHSVISNEGETTGNFTQEQTAELAEVLNAGSLPVPLRRAQKLDRATAARHLEQIALAMHNYNYANGHFPPAVLYGPDGKTPYSWRVALLPYLGEQPLYDQYDFDEAWDNRHNRKVLEKMPAVFGYAEEAGESNSACYFALVGPGTIFDGKKGTRLEDIADGTSDTILLVEAKRDIPWTKPEDIAYDPHKPVPALGGYVEGGFHVAMADTTVRFIPRNVSEKVLRALITKAGGERVELPDALPPSTEKPSTAPVESRKAVAAPAAPLYTQATTNDIQADGTIRFTNPISVKNTTEHDLTTFGFINSDFVKVEKITDAAGKPVKFTAEHQGNHFRYRVPLNPPVPPGKNVELICAGTETTLIKPGDEPGTFVYRMRHWPAADGDTRRVEVHRLPRGAELLDKSPPEMVESHKDGRVELRIERTIPQGGSLEVTYRYRLKP